MFEKGSNLCVYNKVENKQIQLKYYSINISLFYNFSNMNISNIEITKMLAMLKLI